MAQVEFRSWDGSEEGKESATLAHFRDQMFSRWPELGLTWATVCVMAGYTLCLWTGHLLLMCSRRPNLEGEGSNWMKCLCAFSGISVTYVYSLILLFNHLFSLYFYKTAFTRNGGS